MIGQQHDLQRARSSRARAPSAARPRRRHIRPRSRTPPSPSPHTTASSSHHLPRCGNQQNPGIGTDATDERPRRKRNRLPEQKRMALAVLVPRTARPAARRRRRDARRRPASTRRAGTCSGYRPSSVTARSSVVSPVTAIAPLGTVKGAGVSNFGTGGSEFGLLPRVMPPSTQSAMSPICSCVSPCRSGSCRSPSPRPTAACAATARCP